MSSHDKQPHCIISVCCCIRCFGTIYLCADYHCVCHACKQCHEENQAFAFLNIYAYIQF